MLKLKMKEYLTEEQILSLARFFASMYDSMVEFYEDPENRREYRELYYAEYGEYPKD